MPNFPDKFYYKKRSVGVACTTIPTGVPDISRALRGKDDFWLQSDGEADLLSPKVLVLDVYGLIRLEIVDRVEILSIKLPELLSTGFKLYVFYKENIHEITTETLKTILTYDDVLRNSVLLDYEDKAKKALALKGVESEAIFFLDFYNLKLLLPDDSDTKVELKNVSQMLGFMGKETKQLALCKQLVVKFHCQDDLLERFVSWAKEKRPNLTSLQLYNTLGKEQSDGLLTSLKLLEELIDENECIPYKISAHYETCLSIWSFEQKVYRSLLSDTKLGVRELHFRSEVGELWDLDKELVNKIIKYLPNVKKLKVEVEYNKKILQLLQKLQYVTSYDGPSFFKNITRLSSFISRLEYLYLSENPKVKISCYDDSYQFKSLKKLELYVMELGQLKVSCHLLNRAPKLLELVYRCVVNAMIDARTLQLKSPIRTLRSLSIDGETDRGKSTITLDLECVLKYFPNIELITIRQHKVILLHKGGKAKYEHMKIEYVTDVVEDGKIIRGDKKFITLVEGTAETTYYGEKEKEVLLQRSVFASSVSTVPSYSEPTTTASLDADVENKARRFDATEYFTPLTTGVSNPQVSSYRLDIYKCTDAESAKFNIPELELTDVPTSYDITHKPISASTCTLRDAGSVEYYKGSIKLTINEHWQALPSLSPNETITAINIDNKSQADVEREFEIKYSHSQSLYYIRKKGTSTTVHTCTVDILLCVHRARLVIDPSSTEGQRIDYYKKFTAPTTEDQVSSIKVAADKPKELLRLIRELQVGACRHRAMAFVAEFPEGSRLVTNHTHAFVEVKMSWQEESELVGGDNVTKIQWVTVDLGGYPAAVDLIKPAAHVPVENIPTRSDTGSVLELDADQEVFSPGDFAADEPLLKTESLSQELLDTVRKYLKPEHTDPVPISSLDLTVRGDVGRNILILAEDSELIKINLYLHQELSTHGRPVYYIDSPDDLICSARWIKREALVGDVSPGTVMPGPGGSFCEFLQASGAPLVQPVIIVNFNSENFATRDLIRFNSMIDEIAKRVCDGIAIPNKAIIIGLYNHRSTKAYKGDDFYSRFEVQECTTDGVTLPDTISDDVFDKQTACSELSVVIDLMQSGQWKNILLGSWEFSNDLKLVDTTFIKALRRGQTRFHFLNPPKDSKGLKDLLDLAKIKRRITVYGMDVPIPEEFRVTSSTDLSLSVDKLIISNLGASDAIGDMRPLNPSTVEFFLKNFEITADGDYKGVPGYIEATGDGQTCYILVTRTLSLVKWYQLIKAAEGYNVTLNIKVAAGVSLPEELQQTLLTPIGSTDMDMGREPSVLSVVAGVESEDGMSTLPDTSREMMPSCTVVVTQDQDFALDVFMSSLGDLASSALVIDVTDYTVSDLLYNISLGKIGTADTHLKFAKKDCCVLDALGEGLTVVLKGIFKKELVDILSGYMLRMGFGHTSGKLIIITDNDLLFGFAKTKIKIDAGMHASSEYSFVQQKAIESYKKIFPDAADATDAGTFAGLRELPGDFYKLEDCSAEELDTNRLDSVLKVLNKHPFVFLAGASGVGKTTFIDHVLSKDARISAIFMGEQYIKAWAAAGGSSEHGMDEGSDSKIIILFIDEANIAGRNWSEFEGLFQEKPHIIMDGKVHALTPNHKVIFAGNPLSYGGGRTLPSLFARHGHTLIFKPLSLNYIKQKVLEPVFAGVTGSASDVQEEVTNLFLEVYRFFSEECKTLITPRELQMMALIFRARSTETKGTEIRSGDDSSKQLALEIVGRVSRRFVPKEFLEKFDAKFSITVATDVDDEMDAADAAADAADDDGMGGSFDAEYMSNIDFERHTIGADDEMGDSFYAGIHAGIYAPVCASGIGIVSGTDAGAAIMDPLASKQGTEDEEKDGMSHVSEEDSSSDEEEVITGPLIKSKQEQVTAYLSESEFLWTGAHLQLRPYLEDIFAVRAFKASATAETHVQKAGGLGGLIIEGEPGLGKSEAVIAFCKEKDIAITYICASLQSDAKIQMLQEAYYKGAVVVIDEINSSPMLERLINDLLMGRLPAEWRADGKEIIPGFTLIATQNPIYMAGRAATSTAVEHRTMKVVLQDYSLADAAAVLEKKYNLDSVSSKALVQVYDEQKRRAISRGLWPVPNFRDLCKAAKKYAAYCHYQHYLDKKDSIYLCFAVKFGNIKASEDLGDLYVQLGKGYVGDKRVIIEYYQMALQYYREANCHTDKIARVQETLNPPAQGAMKAPVVRRRLVAKMSEKRPPPQPDTSEAKESDGEAEPARKRPRHVYA